MHILILGSGVIGTTAANALCDVGHRVTVVDRQPAAAMETSFANAGEVSPGYSAPWAGPGVPVKAIKWLLMQHGPLVVRPRLDPLQWRWCLAMLRNCTAARYARNKARMVPLAEYSRDCLRELRQQTTLNYDHRTQGTLQLFRTQQQLAGTEDDIAVLERFGVPYEVLDVAGCIAHEPALARVRDKFVGGLRLPGDETGDCHRFTQNLAQQAAAKGVTFHYGSRIDALMVERGVVSGIQTATGPIQADAVVVCLGSYSPALVRPVGIDLPVYPVKGYSITVPITNAAGAPESTVMDETYKVAVTRLGHRIRAGGTAELAGHDLTLHLSRRATLTHVVNDLFETGGDLSRAEFWCGLRPMTPDGTPVIGPTPIKGLWLNTGHGTLGWTMAAGSAKVLSDLMGGRQPAIDAAPLALARYRSWFD